MKEYEMKNIRNLLFIGASGSGKTTLAEQIFYLTKASNRLGRIEEGNTTMDFDPEEIAKGMSLGLSIGYTNYLEHKINILDAPGSPDFIGDAIVALPAVENAVVVANAAGGYEVGLELALEQIEDRKTGIVIVVNRMDNEHSDYDKTLEVIAENTDVKPVKIHIPIGKEGAFEGVVDVIKRKAIKAGMETEVPASMLDKMEEARMQLMEAVAETDEDLLNEYLENMELPEEKLITGLKKGILRGELSPAFVCSAGTGEGVLALLKGIINYLPSPAEANTIEVLSNNEKTNFVCNPEGDLLGYIFKLYADPGMGDFAYVR
ncbi:MAG TPA: GTP-binding protein, partial [Candidatus Cloacimonas sp.]|nr:GTP-binding protein [Candidatus Cloacimonas sp.]